MPLIRSDPFSKWPFSKVLIFELNNFSKCPVFKVIVTHYSSVLLSKILSMKPQAEFATQKITKFSRTSIHMFIIKIRDLHLKVKFSYEIRFW